MVMVNENNSAKAMEDIGAIKWKKWDAWRSAASVSLVNLAFLQPANLETRDPRRSLVWQ